MRSLSSWQRSISDRLSRALCGSSSSNSQSTCSDTLAFVAALLVVFEVDVAIGADDAVDLVVVVARWSTV